LRSFLAPLFFAPDGNQSNQFNNPQLNPQTPNRPPGKSPPPYDYLPFFYSRVFNLSWQFYGTAPAGARVVTFGLEAALAAAATATAAKFGAFWIDAAGRVVGVFVEGGGAEEGAGAKAVARSRPAAPGDAELAAAGAEYLAAAAAAKL
jgi:monodehydroascorbate reductase (NADH)